MTHIALAIGALLASVSFAQKSESPRYPKAIGRIIKTIRPNMTHAELVTAIKKEYPKAHGIGEAWGGGGGTVNFALDDRYSLSVAEVEDLKSDLKPPRRFVNPALEITVGDRVSKRSTNPFRKESKKPTSSGKDLAVPKADCPVGTRAFIGLKGPGCCKDGAICD